MSKYGIVLLRQLQQLLLLLLLIGGGDDRFWKHWFLSNWRKVSGWRVALFLITTTQFSAGAAVRKSLQHMTINSLADRGIRVTKVFRTPKVRADLCTNFINEILMFNYAHSCSISYINNLRCPFTVVNRWTVTVLMGVVRVTLVPLWTLHAMRGFPSPNRKIHHAPPPPRRTTSWRLSTRCVACRDDWTAEWCHHLIVLITKRGCIMLM